MAARHHVAPRLGQPERRFFTAHEPWIETLVEVLQAKKDYHEFLPADGPRELFIIVNEEEVITRKRVLSHCEVVRLAFPHENGRNEDYKVSYFMPPHREVYLRYEGFMDVVEGLHIMVQRG